MNAIAQIPDWHKYLLAILYTLSAVCAAVSTGALALPPGLTQLAPYAALGSFVLASFLPRIQTSTGPGAPPIISPPPTKPVPPQQG